MALGLSGNINYDSVALGSTLLAATITGIGITTLLLPATNTKGFLIQTIDHSKQGVFEGTLFADTSAPASGTDITKRGIRNFGCNGALTTAQTDFATLLIPAGYGLYLGTNQISLANCAVWINGILL
jgi:hypothetical protein